MRQQPNQQLYTKVQLVCASICLWISSSFTFGAIASAATDPDSVDIPRLMAVQTKSYQKLHNSISLDLGYLPIDSFNKGFIVGGSYIYNFSDFFSWEVIHAMNSFNYETNVKSNLAALSVHLAGQTGDLTYVKSYATTNVIYTPIFTKNLLFSRDIIHGDIGFLLGGGAASFQVGSQVTPATMISLGIILDYFVGPRTSFHVDAREQVYFLDTAGGILSMIVGLNYQWGDMVNPGIPAAKDPRRPDDPP